MILSRIAFLTILLLASLAMPVMATDETVKQVPKYLKGSVTDLADYVSTIKGRKLLFIYASWCPYCRQSFPAVLSMNGKGHTVIPISIDKEEYRLIDYLKGYHDTQVTTLLVTSSYKEELNDMLMAIYSAKPWDGSIPHYIVLDENNKIVLDGNYKPEILAKAFLSE